MVRSGATPWRIWGRPSSPSSMSSPMTWASWPPPARPPPGRRCPPPRPATPGPQPPARRDGPCGQPGPARSSYRCQSGRERASKCGKVGRRWSVDELNEVVQDHGLITMRTEAAGANSATERPAVLAVLGTEQPSSAVGALVHGEAAAGAAGGQRGRGYDRLVPPAPGGLAATVGAPAAFPSWRERPTAEPAPCRNGTATRRHRQRRRRGWGRR